MHNRYNLYNLEASFKDYLLAGIESTQINTKDENQHESTRKELKKTSVKNYLSDFRHFLGWMIFYLKSHQLSVGTIHELSLQLTPSVINDYKSYLNENKIPVKTINRRLSTLRKFCSFCVSQGWMKENPAKRVSNVTIRHSGKRVERAHPESDSGQARMTGIRSNQDDILQQFKQDLIKENLDKKTIKSYLDDVRELLQV